MSSQLNLPCNNINVDTPKRAQVLKNILSDTPIENILGRGSYGTVIKAIYKGKEVAIKILENRKKSKTSTIENEANILGWDHENIIKILKIDFQDPYGIVIMERFPGQCLQSILDQLVIPFYHRILISIDTVNALAYCHNHSVIHLDVKPQNILLAFTTKQTNKLPYKKKRDYICKLCDFGSSFKFGNQSKCCDYIMGTVRYMSPEILKRDKITPASDIYSLGITMWQLKSREYPYGAIKNNEVIAYKVVKDNLRPDSQDLQKSPKFLSSRSTTHSSNCICEHLSSDLSNRSSENSAQMKIPSKNLRILSEIRPKINRSPFSNLNNKFNIASSEQLKSPSMQISNEAINLRDRNKDSTIAVTITDDTGKTISYNNKENQSGLEVEFDFKKIFKATKLKNGNIFIEKLEEIYEKLYKKCWEAQPEHRMNIDAIHLELLNILHKLF